jgi:environmental stress-induced protein Ves
VAEAGSFSLFPGFDRWITVVDPGKILTLKVGAAKPIVLKPEDVFHFSGDENTEAQIPNGKLRDLSFIYRRDLVKADMKVVEFSGKPRSFSLTHGQVLLFGVEGRFNISAYPGEHQFSLGPGDAICVDEAPEQVERLLLIEPEPGSGSMVAIEIKKNK